MRTLIAGTRGSALARTQTGSVIARLRIAAPGTRIDERLIRTHGDTSISAPAGDGLFVKELQEALRAGRIDIAVHSFKDVPTEPVDGLRVAAVPVRTDPREALVGSTLAALPAGARVGTSSPRRAAQLLAVRPDVIPTSIRGNVDTRVAKVRGGDYDAALLAAAGLIRLGIEPDEIIDARDMLPAPAQGALAVEIRDDDHEVAALVAAIDDPATRRCAETERAALRELGGGCMLPVGILAEAGDDRVMRVRGGAVSADGRRVVRIDESVDDDDPVVAGTKIAAALIAAGALEVIA
ncbi:MAG TPA: hydroxymethylbilane synthase [Actinomycetota bacterium]|nr:hydroxymethylbilane synthase [Actinomycetota bacterium]